MHEKAAPGAGISRSPEDRVFSVEEVNATLAMAGSSDQRPCFRDLTTADIRSWWTDSNDALCWDVAAIALGVLPEGWRKPGAVCCYEHAAAGVFVWTPSPPIHFAGKVSANDWTETVRSGQYEIAGRLLAAHVELERLRAGGGA